MEPFALEGAVGTGRGAAGTAGFPTRGFVPIGGGFGLAATGGGDLEVNELEGAVASELEGVFFQGVADPLLPAIPGKTETGFADALATEGVMSTLGVGAFLGGAGGGGGGAATAFGGTISSR